MAAGRSTEGKTALITGASSGIGAELARLFAADGIDVVLTARDIGRLEGLACELTSAHKVKAAVVPADLSLPGAAEGLFRRIEDLGPEIDFLVNNAGVGLLGDLRNNAWDDEAAMLRLNMDAPIQLTKLVLPTMLERGNGRILNVASLAAYQPGGPGAAVYYATKAFLLSFSRGLSEELKGSGVTVTALCPGPVATRFAERSAFDRTLVFRSPMVADAAAVARAGYAAMHKGQRISIPGAMAKLFALSSLALPAAVSLPGNRLFLAPRGKRKLS